MLNSHISHIIIMLQTVFLCIISADLGALCRSNILVRHKVVHDKNHLIFIKDTFPLNLLPLSNRNRSRDVISMNQIHLCKNQLTAFHLLQSCVLCQNLLAHRHSHRTLLYLQHFSENTAHNYSEKTFSLLPFSSLNKIYCVTSIIYSFQTRYRTLCARYSL